MSLLKMKFHGQNKESKKEDQLHIVKVCNAQGLCTGNEEICIFVKKLIKGTLLPDLKSLM